MEPLSLDSLWPRTAEICLRKIRGAGSPHHGAAVRRPEAQSAFDADRRRRPPCEVVLRLKERDAGNKQKGGRVSPSDEWASDFEVEKLKNYSFPSQSSASSRVLKVTVSRWEKKWKFSMRACGMCSEPIQADFFTKGRSRV